MAESPLFREKRDWFRYIFPLFQKYITKQYVPVSEAGRRVAAVVADVSTVAVLSAFRPLRTRAERCVIGRGLDDHAAYTVVEAWTRGPHRSPVPACA